MASTAMLAHAVAFEVLHPQTLPQLVDSEFAGDDREVTIVAVTVGMVDLPPHFAGRRLGMRIRCGSPGLSLPCDLRRASANLLAGPRVRPDAASALFCEQGEQPRAVARFGQTCLFMGRRHCDEVVRIQLLGPGLFGTVLGQADLCVPHGARWECELPLACGDGCPGACDEEALARAHVTVHVYTLSKGVMRHFLCLADVDDRGSAFVVDSSALVAAAAPVPGTVVPGGLRRKGELFVGVAEGAGCGAAADGRAEEGSPHVQGGCISGPSQVFKDVMAAFFSLSHPPPP